MVLASVRAGKCLMRTAVHYNAAKYSMARRVTFEEFTAGADTKQLEFMKEQIVQVNEQGHVMGPISKKDGTLRQLQIAYMRTKLDDTLCCILLNSAHPRRRAAPCF